MLFNKLVRTISAAAAVATLALAAGCATGQRSSQTRVVSENATVINLSEVDARMRAQPTQPTQVQRIYEQDGATMMLRHFERGAFVPDHTVPGTVIAHVLQGQLEITIGEQAHTVSEGQVLVMEPHTEHNVRAIEASRMLLTIAAD